METRIALASALAVLLVLSATAAPMFVGRSEATSAGESCETEVRHDAFRSDAAINEVNETGSATSTVENTRVKVEDASAFVRLHANNPNGYCVSLVVEIAPEIVDPADLGKIESNNGSLEAEWRAARNLSSGDVYTRVEVTLPAASNATFAPSELRVKSLAWTGTAKNKTDGLFSGLPDWFGSEDLEQRKYEIQAPNSSDSVTVPLSNGEGQQIEEWQATYTLDGEERPVTQDASAPVYYSESGDSVTFHFNDDRATVSFVADPNGLEKIGHGWDGYTSGISELSEWLPFTALPTPALDGGTA